MIQRLRAPTYVVCLVLWLLRPVADASAAAEERARRKGEQLLEQLAVQFEALQSDDARRIPAEILGEAKGIVILHETRAGLILGGKNGAGAVFVKDPRGWGAPAFYRSREGGIGLQAGWQRATFVQVLMTDAAIQALRTNQFHVGVGLRVTSGPHTVGDEAKTRSAGPDVLIYADTGGLFGGLSLEAGALQPDRNLNRGVYGVDADVVLFQQRPEPTSAGRGLARLLGPPPSPAAPAKTGREGQ